MILTDEDGNKYVLFTRQGCLVDMNGNRFDWEISYDKGMAHQTFLLKDGNQKKRLTPEVSERLNFFDGYSKEYYQAYYENVWSLIEP